MRLFRGFYHLGAWVGQWMRKGRVGVGRLWLGRLQEFRITAHVLVGRRLVRKANTLGFHLVCPRGLFYCGTFAFHAGVGLARRFRIRLLGAGRKSEPQRIHYLSMIC